MHDKDRARLEAVLRELEFMSATMRGVSWQEFSTSSVLQHALIMSLLNVGEAVKRLSQEFITGHNQVQWRKIITIRNVAAHGYESLRMDSIWVTLTVDMPKFKNYIESIL